MNEQMRVSAAESPEQEERELDRTDVRTVEGLIQEIQREDGYMPFSMSIEQKQTLIRLFSNAHADALIQDNKESEKNWVREELSRLRDLEAQKKRRT